MVKNRLLVEEHPLGKHISYDGCPKIQPTTLPAMGRWMPIGRLATLDPDVIGAQSPSTECLSFSLFGNAEGPRFVGL